MAAPLITPSVEPRPARPTTEFRLIEAGRRTARLHLFTYLIGSALFWIGWGALSVTADRWYWWPIIPMVGWTLVLAVHLWRVYLGRA